MPPKKFKPKRPSKPKKEKIGKQAEVSPTQINLLKNVVSSTVGSEVTSIVDLLSGRKNVNEFAIAEKLKLTINQTRNILYKLSDEGLVSFVRKKDKKNGGWYTYFWTLEAAKSLESLQRMISDKIVALEKELDKRSKERFYYCKNCHIEFSEEEALQNVFVCTECGEVLELRDNSNIIEGLNSELSKLKADLETVNEEVAKMAKKSEEAVIRKIKREERDKKAERAARRKEREKEKMKLKKKEAKSKGNTKSKGKPPKKVKKSKGKKRV